MIWSVLAVGALSSATLGCGGAVVQHPKSDAGAIDAEAIDAGATDVRAIDAGAIDAGAIDAGAIDAGAIDAGAIDAGAIDAGATDVRAIDAGAIDAGTASQSIGDQCTAIATEFCSQAIKRCGLVGFTLNDCIANDVPMCCAGSVCGEMSLSSPTAIAACKNAIDAFDCNFIVNSTLPPACTGVPQKP